MAVNPFLSSGQERPYSTIYWTVCTEGVPVTTSVQRRSIGRDIGAAGS